MADAKSGNVAVDGDGLDERRGVEALRAPPCLGKREVTPRGAHGLVRIVRRRGRVDANGRASGKTCQLSAAGAFQIREFDKNTTFFCRAGGKKHFSILLCSHLIAQPNL